MRSRGWTFTWNNFKTDDTLTLDILKNLKCEKIIFQEEIGKSGTEHIQGYIYWKNARAFSTVKRLLPKCHIEAARNDIAAKRYCEKLDTSVTDGIKYSRGFKTAFQKEQDLRTQQLGTDNPLIRDWVSREFEAAIPNIVDRILNNPDRYPWDQLDSTHISDTLRHIEE